MIQEDEDEETVIDFSWIYFMGTAKFGLSIKETGRLTMCMFLKLLEHYKRTWSNEMILFKKGMTYEQAYIESQQEKEWF